MGGLSIDGTFAQCFPKHSSEHFARTCVTSLIIEQFGLEGTLKII